MRKQFVQTVEALLKDNPDLCLLLGDIGVFGFKQAFETYPDRVLNIGILEQSTVGVAAGMSKAGMIPIVHTIAPFLIERAFEQIKDDFCYQKLRGNFVTVGASYDYASLGCTHHCPGDVEILKAIPGMEIIVPGTPQEFDSLFKQTYANASPTYFRLTERSNPVSYPVEFGKAQVLKRGREGTVIAVGPALKSALVATEGLDVTLLYYTTITPFDSKTLLENSTSARVVLIEPYYEGGLAAEITKAMGRRPHTIDFIGVPKAFLTHYGKAEEHDEALGLTGPAVRKRLIDVLDLKDIPSGGERVIEVVQ